MTLRKLTLSIGLLAASLTLAAPAQAETWSCSYYDKVKKGPMPFSFVRNGGTFDVPIFKAAMRIINENSKVIHLHTAWYKEKVPLYSVALFKDTKRFAMAFTTDGKG